MSKGRISNLSGKKVVPVDDIKIRQTLMLMVDKYNEMARQKIVDTYNDINLLQKYERIRASGVFKSGGTSKVHRQIVAFPNYEVFDFVDTVMNAKYGQDWLYDNRALRHELVKCWWVVDKL